MNGTKRLPRTPEQRRAEHALAALRQIQDDQNASVGQRYRSYVERLGPAILMNGLGQALATERAAAGDADGAAEQKRAHGLVFQKVASWLCRPGGVYPGHAPNQLLEAIVEGAEEEYLRAQTEALAWLTWHKKFCRAYLPTADQEEG